MHLGLYPPLIQAVKMRDNESQLSPGLKIFLAIIYPNFGLFWGTKVIEKFEITSTGSQWPNLFETPLPGNPISVGVVWAVFIASMLFYGTITWYIDSVHPGPYGAAKRWYFCFQVCNIN